MLNMAVSAAALPALSATLFEEAAGTKERKFACFCEEFRTLIEAQVRGRVQEQEVARTLFQRSSQRIEAEVESAKLRFYATAVAPVETTASLHAYREKVGACAYRKNASLEEITRIYVGCIQRLANELLPLVQSKQTLQDIFVKSREAVRSRFEC